MQTNPPKHSASPRKKQRTVTLQDVENQLSIMFETTTKNALSLEKIECFNYLAEIIDECSNNQQINTPNKHHWQYQRGVYYYYRGLLYYKYLFPANTEFENILVDKMLHQKTLHAFTVAIESHLTSANNYLNTDDKKSSKECLDEAIKVIKILLDFELDISTTKTFNTTFLKTLATISNNIKTIINKISAVDFPLQDKTSLLMSLLTASFEPFETQQIIFSDKPSLEKEIALLDALAEEKSAANSHNKRYELYDNISAECLGFLKNLLTLFHEQNSSSQPVNDLLESKAFFLENSCLIYTRSIADEEKQKCANIHSLAKVMPENTRSTSPASIDTDETTTTLALEEDTSTSTSVHHNPFTFFTPITAPPSSPAHKENLLYALVENNFSKMPDLLLKAEKFNLILKKGFYKFNNNYIDELLSLISEFSTFFAGWPLIKNAFCTNQKFTACIKAIDTFKEIFQQGTYPILTNASVSVIRCIERIDDASLMQLPSPHSTQQSVNQDPTPLRQGIRYFLKEAQGNEVEKENLTRAKTFFNALQRPENKATLATFATFITKINEQKDVFQHLGNAITISSYTPSI